MGAPVGSTTGLAAGLVAGRYRRLRELGRGSSGRVLLAEDTAQPGRQVALKVVAAEHAQRLRWEFERLRSVSDPGICRAYELVVDADGPSSRGARLGAPGALPTPVGEPVRVTLVCEHIEGQPARSAMLALPEPTARGRLPAVLDVGRRIASALSAIHAEGLVHGDVKPDNIVVHPTRGAVLVDFGLCRRPGLDGTIAGTPGFLAPELFAGELRFESDHYALGVTLLRLLDADPRQRPTHHAGGSTDAVPFPSPPAVPSHLPDDLSELLTGLLRARPDDRPRSMREVAARLEALCVAHGGAERDGVSAEEPAAHRAQRMLALPHVGADDARAALMQHLGAAGVVFVLGPAGSGRSRLVREAVAALQRRCAETGAPAPSYQAGGPRPTRLQHDRIWHLDAAGAPSGAAVGSAIAAAEVAGHRLTVVLEGAAPPHAAEGTQAHEAREVHVGPLSAGALRQLLAHALPDARLTGALMDAATTVSGGLAGRLCRLLASGASAGQELSRPTVLASLAEARPASPMDPNALAGLPSGLAPVARALAWVGGRAPSGALTLDTHALASARSAGILSLRDDGSLALRPDLVSPLRAAGPVRRSEVVRALDRSRLDAFGRAMLQLSLGDRSAAQQDAVTALRQARDAGDPERAAALATALAGDLERGPVSAAGGGRPPQDTGAVSGPRLTAAWLTWPWLAWSWADALRAAGHYRQALERLSAAGRAAPLPDAAQRLEVELLRLLGDLDGAERRLKTPDPAQAVASVAWAGLAARVAFDRGDHRLARQRADRALAAAGARAGEAPAHPSDTGPLDTGPLDTGSSDTGPLDTGPGRALEVLALCDLAAGEAAAAAERLYAALGGQAGQLAPPVQARLLLVLGAVERHRGHVGAASDAYRRALHAADLAGERHTAASARVNLGNMWLDSGELGSAMEALRDAARRLCLLARDADQWRALYNLTIARHLAGDLEGAVFSCERAQAAAGRAADAEGQALSDSLRAELALGRGRLDQARAWVQRLGDGAGAVAHVPPAAQVVVLGRGVEIALGLDKSRLAEALAKPLTEASSRAGTPAARAEVFLAELRLAVAAQMPPADLTTAAQAAVAALDGSPAAAGFGGRLRVLLLAARAHQDAGDTDGAEAQLGHARRLLDIASRDLGRADRERLRQVPAYQVAFEVRPTGDGQGSPPRSGAMLDTAGDAGATAREVMRTARRIVAERRLGPLYERIVEGALDLTTAQRGYVAIRDRSGQLRVRASAGLAEHEPAPSVAALSSSIVGEVLATGRPVATTDARADQRLSGAQSVHALSLRSVVAVPLVAGEGVMGALYLEDRLRPEAFSGADVARLADLAALAVPAIEAAQLLRRERRTARRLAVAQARLSRQLEAQALELHQLKRRKVAASPASGLGIVGQSAPLQRALSLASRVSHSEVPVLLLGESGTGKELFAQAIHSQGPRADRPFITENCSAIPEGLLESTLFGHVRGAFTGADRARQGLFEIADGGTLLLDEVGDMPPAMQVRLLRVLQDGMVRPVGGERARKVDVRVIGATHRDLEAMVREGSFRQDLYYRLAVVSLRLPALRERPDDIGDLVAHFVQRHAPGRGIRIDRRALSRLLQFSWPGNIRQLENEVRRALLLADDVITEAHLSPEVLGIEDAPPDDLDLKAQVGALERRLIRRALEASAGNQTKAARVLGVSRYGLQKMIRRLEL